MSKMEMIQAARGNLTSKGKAKAVLDKLGMTPTEAITVSTGRSRSTAAYLFPSAAPTSRRPKLCEAPKEVQGCDAARVTVLRLVLAD